MDRLIPITIERIPRLTRPVLEDLLLRRFDEKTVACLSCRAIRVALLPIYGQLLCEDCATFKVLGLRR
jgi:hypothetical protein